MFDFIFKLQENNLYEKNQPFQIGTFCKIIGVNNTFCYPPMPKEEYLCYNLIVQIIGSYWQLCGTYFYYSKDDRMEPIKNLSSFQVILSKKDNPQCFEDGIFNYNNIMCTKVPQWSWIEDFQMEFYRNPDENELEKAIELYKEAVHKIN